MGRIFWEVLACAALGWCVKSHWAFTIGIYKECGRQRDRISGKSVFVWRVSDSYGAKRLHWSFVLAKVMRWLDLVFRSIPAGYRFENALSKS